MNESFEEATKKIKDKEDTSNIYRASCDILRALLILHGSAWQSDLSNTLEELWTLRGLSRDERASLEKALPEALNLLNSKAIVSSQKRARGRLSGKSSDEVLHSLKKHLPLIQILGGDRDIDRYRREVMGYSQLRFD